MSMNRNTKALRSNVLFVMIALLLSTTLAGCGLFGGAERERVEENEEVTQGIDLGDVVTAQGVGEGNRPIDETNDFSASQDVIYVVAEVDHIEEGTTLFARWYRDGEAIEDSSEIVADRDYTDTYLEFHLTNEQNEFEEGDYRVEILANGNPVEEVEFSIN
jgi:hypothetical protein